MTDLYLIWSNEHRAWWGPGRHGYAKRLEHAGRYSRDDAIRICADAIPGQFHLLGMMPEVPVRVEDVQAVLRAFAVSYPGRDPEAS